ncbi:hypothetical protein LINPERPRIM_LOCUS27189 [Linum perenne]
MFRSTTFTVKRTSLLIIWLTLAIALSLGHSSISLLIVLSCIGLDTILLVFVSLGLFIIIKGFALLLPKKRQLIGP